MYSVCLRYANSKDEANDMFQQAFYLVYKNLKQVKNPEALSGWIKRIFINTALEILKKNAKFSSVENIDEFDDSEQNWNDAIQKINTEEIAKLIQKLPKGCRLVFNLYIVEGYSHKEIAEQLEISVGTSKSQLHDARKTLKAAIIDLGDGVEGTLRASELSRDRVEDASTILKVGEEVESKLIGIDRKNRGIALSIKAKDYDDESEALRDFSDSQDASAGAAPTLGDLMKEQMKSKED